MNKPENAISRLAQDAEIRYPGRLARLALQLAGKPMASRARRSACPIHAPNARDRARGAMRAQPPGRPASPVFMRVRAPSRGSAQTARHGLSRRRSRVRVPSLP
jgi:hypothetical protein